MKHLKIIGSLALAGLALLAFAGNASAVPTLTSPAGTEYTGEIHMTLESGSSSVTKAGIEDKCTASTMRGEVSVNTEMHAESALSALTFEGCTQDTTVVNPGKLTINSKGEVFISERRVEITVTSLPTTCFYGAETGSVKIGTLTGGSPATLDINTTELQRLAGSNTFFCAAKGTWTGSYLVTTPSSLFIT